jgi:hypothetical protein
MSITGLSQGESRPAYPQGVQPLLRPFSVGRKPWSDPYFHAYFHVTRFAAEDDATDSG